MHYPKPLMKISELKKMGFTDEYLRTAYRSRNQNFATKINPGKRNSPVMFDTEEFEKYRQRQIRMQTGGKV